MKTLLVLALFTSLISGCAKSSEATSSVPVNTSSKELFSTWTSTSTPSVPVDLSSAVFDNFSPVTLNFTSGSTCSCNIYFTGTKASGTFGLSQCTPSGGTDPGCGSWNGTGSYSNVNAVLTLCNPYCVTYK